MDQMQYVCPKCGCRHYEHDQFQATGGNFAKALRHPEQALYHGFLRPVRLYGALSRRRRRGMDILDFLLGG